jgi:hypothetical protein
MGMFDYYIPEPSLSCPVCGGPLEGWQGKDADCLLLYWKQGQRSPIKSDWPEESIENQASFLASFTLPDVFEFYTWGCKCDRRIDAYGFCENGVWVRSEIVTHLNFRPGTRTSSHDEHSIQNELQKWLESKRP